MLWPTVEFSTVIYGLLVIPLAPLLLAGLRYSWLLVAVKLAEEKFAKRQAEVNKLFREEEYWERLHAEVAGLDEWGRRVWLERIKQTT